LALLDRQEGGREAILAKGLALQALFSRDDLDLIGTNEVTKNKR
jgi:orotate phosphoribosyltransferase